jgi:hypothetical protein
VHKCILTLPPLSFFFLDRSIQATISQVYWSNRLQTQSSGARVWSTSTVSNTAFRTLSVSAPEKSSATSCARSTLWTPSGIEIVILLDISIYVCVFWTVSQANDHLLHALTPPSFLFFLLRKQVRIHGRRYSAMEALTLIKKRAAPPYDALTKIKNMFVN